MMFEKFTEEYGLFPHMQVLRTYDDMTAALQWCKAQYGLPGKDRRWNVRYGYSYDDIEKIGYTQEEFYFLDADQAMMFKLTWG